MEGRGGKHLCMMDERWRGLHTVRCSRYLSYAFLIRRMREGQTGGGLEGCGARMEGGDEIRGGVKK